MQVIFAAQTVQLSGDDLHKLAEHGAAGTNIMALYIVLVLVFLAVGGLILYLRFRGKTDAKQQQAALDAFIVELASSRSDFTKEIDASRQERKEMAARHEQFITETARETAHALDRNTEAVNNLHSMLSRVPCIDRECSAYRPPQS